MTVFRVPFEMEIDVTFKDPEKAKKYFIDEDEWKSVFWTMFSLEELASHIAGCLHDTGHVWDKDEKSFAKSIEGFGTYVSGDNGKWRTNKETAKECGHIEVKYRTELTSEDGYDIAV